MDIERYEARPKPPSPAILVIDDALFCRELVSKALCQQGYNVVTAGNGPIGLAVLQRVAVQLIILDYKMPLMNGVAFLRHLRENPDWASLPVIMLTDSGLKETVLEAMDCGAVEYILKAEFSLDRLLRSVRKWLLKEHKERQHRHH